MKSIFTTIFTLCILSLSFSQEFPSLKIKDSKANSFSTENIITKSYEEQVVVSFWASWCVSCINELSAINDNLVDWKDEVDFTLYAITIDDSRAVKKALALANGKAWDFEVLLDENQDLKRALNFANVPYLVVVKNGKIIHAKNSYTKGSEDELFEFLTQNSTYEIKEENTTETVTYEAVEYTDEEGNVTEGVIEISE